MTIFSTKDYFHIIFCVDRQKAVFDTQTRTTTISSNLTGEKASFPVPRREAYITMAKSITLVRCIVVHLFSRLYYIASTDCTEHTCAQSHRSARSVLNFAQVNHTKSSVSLLQQTTCIFNNISHYNVMI